MQLKTSIKGMKNISTALNDWLPGDSCNLCVKQEREKTNYLL